MLGITRYILKQLVLGVVIVTASLSMLIWLTQSLRFVELILNKGLSVTSFISLTMLLLPSFLV
ncbi:MAG: LptF/LptG family permease, partial [Alphaproteobacteria bacterium]|nr:LptF/LptG family permease [Alphaproteobacteria bacterium]